MHTLTHTHTHTQRHIHLSYSKTVWSDGSHEIQETSREVCEFITNHHLKPKGRGVSVILDKKDGQGFPYWSKASQGWTQCYYVYFNGWWRSQEMWLELLPIRRNIACTELQWKLGFWLQSIPVASLASVHRDSWITHRLTQNIPSHRVISRIPWKISWNAWFLNLTVTYLHTNYL